MKLVLIALLGISSASSLQAMSCKQVMSTKSLENINSYELFIDFLIAEISSMTNPGLRHYSDSQINVAANNIIRTAYASSYFAGNPSRFEYMMNLVSELYKIKRSYHSSTGHKISMEEAMIQQLRTSQWRGELAPELILNSKNPSSRGTVEKGMSLANRLLRVKLTIDEYYANPKRLEELEAQSISPIRKSEKEEVDSTPVTKASNSTTSQKTAFANKQFVDWSALKTYNPIGMTRLTIKENLIRNWSTRLKNKSDLTKTLDEIIINFASRTTIEYLAKNPMEIPHLPFERLAENILDNYIVNSNSNIKHQAAKNELVEIFFEAIDVFRTQLPKLTQPNDQIKYNAQVLDSIIKSVNTPELNL